MHIFDIALESGTASVHHPIACEQIKRRKSRLVAEGQVSRAMHTCLVDSAFAGS